MVPHHLLLLLLLTLLLPLTTRAGFWSASEDQPADNVEVSTSGEATTTPTTSSNNNNNNPTCPAALPELPNKLLGPLGGATRAISILVFLTDKGSSWWCGGESTLTSLASQQSRSLRSSYSKIYLADTKTNSVRSTFGITKKSQLPAVAVIEPMTGRRFVLRNGEGEIPSLLLEKNFNVILEIFRHPKPLDLFDLSWVTMQGSGLQMFMDEKVDLVIIMVKNSKQAKQLVKSGLRRVAQRRRGSARVVLSKDPQLWRRYGVTESSVRKRTEKKREI